MMQHSEFLVFPFLAEQFGFLVLGCTPHLSSERSLKNLKQIVSFGSPRRSRNTGYSDCQTVRLT